MTEAPKANLRGFLEEVVPALMAAGLTRAQVQAIGDETARRMGDGGPAAQWVMTMATVVAPMDHRYLVAFKLAMDEWLGPDV